MFPSAEHPDPKSDVFESLVLRAASSMSAVSSITIVALPLTDSERRFARAVGGLDHRRPPGGERHVADGHQLLGQRDGGLLHALEDVRRGALSLHDGAHDA